MSDETKPDGPMYIATKQIPRVEVPQNTLDAVLSELRAMRVEGQETQNEIREVKANQEILTSHVNVLTNRVALVEQRQSSFDDRVDKHSGGLVRESQLNQGQNTAIAMLHTKVDTLATSLETNNAATSAIQKSLGEFLQKHPTIVAGVVSLITTALGVATAWIASKGH